MAAKSNVIASLSRRSRTPKREPTWIRSPVSSLTSLFNALTSDSPRLTLPPGSVQSLKPAAWRTSRTPSAESSIQAITETSLVGRNLGAFVGSFCMLWFHGSGPERQADSTELCRVLIKSNRLGHPIPKAKIRSLCKYAGYPWLDRAKKNPRQYWLHGPRFARGRDR
jgi:hypothetical protein